MMKIIIMKISIKFNENNEVYLQKKKKKSEKHLITIYFIQSKIFISQEKS